MSDSIKQRLGGSHIGKMNDKELRKLLLAALADLTAIRSVVMNLSADANNVQIVLNNLGNGLNNVRATACNIVADVRNIRACYNAVITNCTAATALAALAVGNTSLTTNINEATLAGGTSPDALTLVA